MDYKINIIELNDFHNMVDGIVADIEAGKITSNPLKKEFTNVGEVIIGSTSTETSLEDTETALNHAEEDPLEFDLTGLLEGKGVIIRATKTNNIVAAYMTAADAARAQGMHQTTVRERCKAGYADKNGLTWSYYNAERDGRN